MITRMSKSVSSFFILQGIIPDEDREVYEYSFEVMLSTIISFLALTILALVSRTTLFATLYLIGFIPLRIIAGGFHAKNHYRCVLILIVVYCTFLFTLFILPIEYMRFIAVLSVFLSALSVFLIAPSEDKNKPFSVTKITRLKKNSRIIVIGYILMINLMIILVPDTRVAFSIAMGVFSVGVSLLANYIKNIKHENGNKAIKQEGGKANEET